ncbi:MAG: fpvA 2 [Verrucomicrobia bacterium]|nr:fpvA 2 [Verrucomicrobiota bacterium]
MQQKTFAAAFVLRFGLASLAVFSALALRAQNLPANPAPGDAQPVQLDPFKVSVSQDQGYRAGNSVSATRIDTPIKDLPFTLTAFTQQFITDINQNDLLGTLRYAPGVSGASSDFTGGNAQYVVDGFPQYPLRNGIPGAYFIADTANIERVEVVQGPASLLYGAISPGGTANYITKTAQPKPFADVTLQGGSYGFYRGQLDLNQPLVGDRVLFRFNAEYQNLFQWVKPSQSRDFEIAPTLTWKTSLNSELTVSYELFHRRESPQVFKKIDVLDPNTFQDLGVNVIYPNPLPHSFNFLSNNDWRHTDQEVFNADEHLRIGEHWSVRASYQWQASKVDELYTGISNLVGNPNGTVPLEGRRVRYQLDSNGNNTYELEAAAKYDFGTVKWKPVFGFFADNTRQYEIQRTASASQYPPAWNLYDPKTWDYNTFFVPSQLPLGYEFGILASDLAYYTVQTVELFDSRLILVGGARYSLATNQTVENPRFGPVVDDPGFKTHITTPQLGAGYKLAPDVMLYASYSESFQPQAFGLFTNDVPSGPAKPIVGKGYEVGIKTDLMNGRISGTLAAFDIKETNLVQTLIGAFNPVTGVSTSSTVQVGEAESKGVTAELTYSPLDNWQLFASATFNHAYLSKNPQDPTQVGDPLQYSTRRLANLWTRYNFTGSLKGFYLGGGFNYTGPKSFGGPGNPLLISGYTLWNGLVGYDGTWQRYRFTVTVNADNLTNVYYDNSNYDRGLPRRFIGSVVLHF